MIWIKNANVPVFSLSLVFILLLPITLFVASDQWVKNESTYLLIHTIMEGFAVLVSFMVFSVGWNSYHESQRCNTVVLACAFLAVGLIDLGHILSYQGMPNFISYNTPHKAIIFWLAARFLVAISLFVVFFFKWKAPVAPITRYILLSASILFTGFIYYIGLFQENSVPITFVEGHGLASFKIAAEYFIMLILVMTIFVSRKRPLYENDRGYLTAGLLMMAASGLCFTLYFSTIDNFNLLGHIYKVVAYMFIYKAIFVDQVQEPYRKLRVSEKQLQRLTTVLEKTPDFVATADMNGRVLYYNQSAKRMLGIDDDENLSLISIGMTHPAWAAKLVLEEGLPTAAQEGSWYGETAFLSRSGEEIPVSQIILSHQDVHGKLEFFSTIARDLTYIKESEKKLHLSAKIIESMNEGVIITDLKGNIVATNPAFTRLTGYGEKEAQGKNIYFLLSERHSLDFFDDVWEKLKDYSYWQGEIWNKHKNGSSYAVDMRVHSIYNDKGQLESYASIIGDITERKLNEEEMRYRANYDSLTSLPNRDFFHKRLIEAIKEAERNQSKLAVMFLDFDGFKGVNDSCGHLDGDQLLKQFAGRIKLALSDRSDNIARLGGDEFILFTEINHKQDAETVAEKLLEVTSRPYRIDDCDIKISSSIGISLYPNNGHDVETLIKIADEAMYLAKKRGKNNYQFIDQPAAFSEKPV